MGAGNKKKGDEGEYCRWHQVIKGIRILRPRRSIHLHLRPLRHSNHQKYSASKGCSYTLFHRLMRRVCNAQIFLAGLNFISV